MLNRGRTRSTLIGIVAAYLLYTAWELFRDRADVNTTMTMGARIAFIVLFVLAGLGLGVYSLYIWRQSLKEDGEPQKPEEDKDSLK